MYKINLKHHFSYGHRLLNHQGKCAHLHGHNGLLEFVVASDKLDKLGMVMDFYEIKEKLCRWIDVHWDHRFLVHDADPIVPFLVEADPKVCIMHFNPTAENMTKYLVEEIGPLVFEKHGVLVSCTLHETEKCSATYSL